MSEDTMARQGRDMEKPEGIVILFLMGGPQGNRVRL